MGRDVISHFILYTTLDIILVIMKHLTKRLDEELYSSRTLDFYFNGLHAGVLDIETTGLNPSRNKFILGGLFDLQDMTMYQVFAENRNEEADALREFAERLSGLDMIITYNGRHFDMPFICRRSGSFSIKVSQPYNLDLYLVLNGHSPIKKFVPNLKQKTIENYMGLWQSRSDEISGGESVELYNMYEKTGDSRLEKKILLHNSDDVLQLARLIKVTGKADFHKAMFHLGFPAGPLTVEKIRIDSGFITISGVQRSICIDYIGFSVSGSDFPAESRFDSATSRFVIRIPVIRDLGLVIVDLKAAGIPCSPFEIYPAYSSGFLVLEEHGCRNYMEINHFVKGFINVFIKSL